jgi:hypothetical protein
VTLRLSPWLRCRRFQRAAGLRGFSRHGHLRKHLRRFGLAWIPSRPGRRPLARSSAPTRQVLPLFRYFDKDRPRLWMTLHVSQSAAVGGPPNHLVPIHRRAFGHAP